MRFFVDAHKQRQFFINIIYENQLFALRTPYVLDDEEITIVALALALSARRKLMDHQ